MRASEAFQDVSGAINGVSEELQDISDSFRRFEGYLEVFRRDAPKL